MLSSKLQNKPEKRESFVTCTAQLSTVMLHPFSILLNKYSNENLLEKCPHGHVMSAVGKETNPIWVKFTGLVL